MSRLVQLVCVLALAVALVVGSPLDGPTEEQLQHTMQSWPQGELMPLLRVPEELVVGAHIEPFDQPQKTAFVESSSKEDVALLEQSSDSDSNQEIDVVVDSSAQDKAEADALMQNEVDAELDVDSESESSQETEVEASEPEIEAAKSVLNAVVDEPAEDYPSLAEVHSDSDSNQEIDVVVDSSAEDKAEADALMQNEVDAELDVDSESESDQEAEVEASEPEIEAAKTVLNAVADEAAEDYPALAEVHADSDSTQEVEVVVDSSAEDKAEADALMQNEVDAELDTDSESDESSESETEEASAENCAKAHEVLNSVTGEPAEDYPVLAEVESDSDSNQEIDVVVDSSAQDKAEAEAIMQNEVDAELDVDSESESTQETEVEASEPEIEAAKSLLNAVVDEAAEDYPSLAEVDSTHDPIVHSVVWSGNPVNINAKRDGEIDPVMIPASQPKPDQSAVARRLKAKIAQK